MKKKTFTYGITFFVRPSMYDDLKRVSDDLGISMSDLLRGMIEEYLAKNAGVKAYDQLLMVKDHMEVGLEKMVEHEELTPNAEDTRDGLL